MGEKRLLVFDQERNNSLESKISADSRFLTVDDNDEEKNFQTEELKKLGAATDFKLTGFLRPDARAQIQQEIKNNNFFKASQIFKNPGSFVKAKNIDSARTLRDNGFVPVADDDLPEGVAHTKPINEIFPDTRIGARIRAIKSFATTPQQTIDFLESELGLEARVADTGLLGATIAIRDPKAVKGSKKSQWHVLDPEGFQIGDLFSDVADLSGIVLNAAVSGVTALGGLAALGTGVASAPGLAAIAAAGSAGELAQESVGSFLGLENNISPGRIALAAPLEVVGFGAVKGLGKVASAAGRKFSSVAGDVLEKVDFIDPLLEKAVARLGAGKTVLKGLKTDRKLAKQIIKNTADEDLEVALARGLVETVQDAKVTPRS